MQNLDLSELPDKEYLKNLDLSGLPDKEVSKDIDLSGLPDKEKKPVISKPLMGAGGSFEEPFETKFMREHPNLYGVLGAVSGTAEELTKYSYLKYIYPEEREKFNALSNQKQTRQLLLDNLEAVIGLGVGPISKGAGQIVKKVLPSTYKFLTTPIGRKATEPIRTAADQGVKVMDLIGKRRSSIDVGMLRSNIFIKQFEKKLSKQELEAIPFIRQGIKDPQILAKIGREDLIPVVKNPSTNTLQATEKIGKYYDESHKFLKDHWGDVGFVENYVTQIWNIPKNRRSEVVNYFATRNPFTKKRSIPTLEEGIKLGLEPKTTNIADLLRIYDQYKVKTAYNYTFAKDLTKLTDDGGTKLVMRSDKAPIDWSTIDHPALNRAIMIGKTKTETPILTKIPVKVHPDIAKEVKIIFDKPFSHPAIQAMEVINAFTKKGMLSLSFFHHHALTESAFSTGIGKKALSLWNPAKIVKALKNRDYEIFRRQPLTEDALNYGGVTFGALDDVQRGVVAKSLEGLEHRARNIPGLNKVTKGMRKGNELWDAALWDYYHNTLKLWAYEKNVVDGLKTASQKIGRPLKPDEISAVKKEMGKFVNDSFGGQNWDLNKTLGNPKMKQMMHWALLAPDWTLSTLKQARAPLKGTYKWATGKTDTERIAGKALTKQGAMFWAKAGLYFNTIAQSVNYYNTNREYGKGRFTWENAPGHALNIFIGRNKDGTERYLRMGKQFREVIEWGLNPVDKLGAKLSPVARETMRQITAHNPGSGYPTEWAEKEGMATIPGRLKSLAESPLPFSLRPYIESRPNVYMFTFPTSKGMTNYKTVDLFKKSLKTKNLDQVRRIFISALENNLDAQQLFKTAKASVKADITYDNKTVARELLEEMESLGPKARDDALQIYRNRGTLTPAIALEMDKLINKDSNVKLQQKALKLKGKGLLLNQ